MKLDLFLVIGIVVNTMFAVLYPAQIFGDDPLGLNGAQLEGENSLSQYYTVNGTSVLNGYDANTGELKRDKSILNTLQGGVVSTDGSAGVLTSEVFGFVDWVKVGYNLIKSMLMFVIGFVLLLWNLAYPFNFLIGVPFSMLYMFSMASFIIGRG